MSREVNRRAQLQRDVWRAMAKPPPGHLRFNNEIFGPHAQPCCGYLLQPKNVELITVVGADNSNHRYIYGTCSECGGSFRFRNGAWTVSEVRNRRGK